MPDKFKYDPEKEEESGNGKYRLPFALCKARGIKIEDWWTPRHAWEALKKGGLDVDDAYKDYYRKKKKSDSKKRSASDRQRDKKKKEQLANPDYNPTEGYVHEDGKIDGVAKGKPMTFEEADSGHVNPNITKDLIGYRHNCQTCVAVYVARRQGYDVSALPNLDNKNIYDLSLDTSLAYLNEKGEHPTRIKRPFGQSKQVFLDNTVKEGGIYSLQFMWRGRSSGHIVTAEKVNGKVRLYDPQTNKTYSDKEIASFLASTERQSIMDLTNVRMDESFCDKIMKRGKR